MSHNESTSLCRAGMSLLPGAQQELQRLREYGVSAGIKFSNAFSKRLKRRFRGRMAGKQVVPEAVVGFNGTTRNGLLPLPDGEQWVRSSGSSIVIGGLSKSGKLNPWFLRGHSNTVFAPLGYLANLFWRRLLLSYSQKREVSYVCGRNLGSQRKGWPNYTLPACRA